MPAGEVADGHRGLDWCFAPLNRKSWCGTRRRRARHVRFNACAVVRAHLHIRGTNWIDGVPFQDDSLGYPNHWKVGRGIGHCLHELVPAPAHASHEDG